MSDFELQAKRSLASAGPAERAENLRLTKRSTNEFCRDDFVVLAGLARRASQGGVPMCSSRKVSRLSYSRLFASRL